MSKPNLSAIPRLISRYEDRFESLKRMLDSYNGEDSSKRDLEYYICRNQSDFKVFLLSAQTGMNLLAEEQLKPEYEERIWQHVSRHMVKAFTRYRKTDEMIFKICNPEKA